MTPERVKQMLGAKVQYIRHKPEHVGICDQITSTTIYNSDAESPITVWKAVVHYPPDSYGWQFDPKNLKIVS